jgi:hypothetical protein
LIKFDIDPPKSGSENSRKILLMLENLFKDRKNEKGGKNQIRMLDLKVGSVTAVANWQGKSSFGSWTQKFIDKLTNSKAEGFRLEGFDGKPDKLNNLLQHRKFPCLKQRVTLQSLNMVEILEYFLDLSELKLTETAGKTVTVQEMVMCAVCTKMLDL